MKREKDEPISIFEAILDVDSGEFRQFVTPSQDASEDVFRSISNELTTNPDAAAALLGALSAQEERVNTRTAEIDRLGTSMGEDIPNEEFFGFLRKYGSSILNMPFAQQKMQKWESQKRNADEDEAWHAQDSLKRIGMELAFRGHDRERTPETILSLVNDRVYEVLRDQDPEEMAENGDDIIEELFEVELTSEDVLDRKIRDILVNIENYDKSYGDRACRSLAKLITAKLFGIKENTINKYLKNVDKQATDDAQFQIYSPKK